MEVNKEYQVTIISQDHFGNGIAKLENKTVFVKKALSGEVCNIRIVNDKKSYAQAELVSVCEKSSDRVEPTCPYASSCGGCSLLHQKYESACCWKEQKVTELLAKFANYHGKIEPIKASQPFAYRNKVTCYVSNQSLALSEEESHHRVPIDRCLLLTDATNRLIGQINEYLKTYPSFEKIMIRTNLNNDFLLSITGALEVESFGRIVNDSSYILFHNGTCLSEKDYLEMNLFDMSFLLSPESFFQVNLYQTETLYRLVLEDIKKQKPSRVLDLYCGTGTIGLLASPYAKEVVGVEVVESAIVNANQNKQRNKIENVTFHQSKVEDMVETLGSFDYVIVDPPRKGLDTKTREVLKKMKASHICYISCDPATLARDLMDLQEEYEVKSVTPVDMFPNTYHVECVSLLVRKTFENKDF